MLLSLGDVIDVTELPQDLNRGHEPKGTRLEDLERNHILKVLKESGGQRGKAAEVLGIDPKTLYRKLQSYGVSE
jgi:DNA-binding NtrC family response regulator